MCRTLSAMIYTLQKITSSRATLDSTNATWGYKTLHKLSQLGKVISVYKDNTVLKKNQKMLDRLHLIRG